MTGLSDIQPAGTEDAVGDMDFNDFVVVPLVCVVA
jgi:hypothetical protein